MNRFIYSPDDLIGGGSFGVVFRAKDTMTGDTVAVKKIKNEKVHDENELDILKAIANDPHPNLLNLIHHEKDATHVTLVTQYGKGGDLGAFFESMAPLSEELLRHFGRELAMGLKALADRGVVHRDLKLLYHNRGNRRTLTPKVPSNVSPELNALLCGLLQMFPDDRFNFDEFLNHPFLVQHQPQPPAAKQTPTKATREKAGEEEAKAGPSGAQQLKSVEEEGRDGPGAAAAAAAQQRDQQEAAGELEVPFQQLNVAEHLQPQQELPLLPLPLAIPQGAVVGRGRGGAAQRGGGRGRGRPKKFYPKRPIHLQPPHPPPPPPPVV